MRKLAGILFASLLFFTFGVSAHADTLPTGSLEKELEDAVLIDTQTDPDTGVQVGIYKKENESLITPFAGDGSWDVVGSDNWLMTGDDSNLRTDATFHSLGGDYGFKVPPHDYDEFLGYNDLGIVVELWEEDVGSGNDDYVGTFAVKGAANYTLIYAARGVNAFVDGARAEFYTKHGSNYTVPGNFINVTYLD
ncbi:hypothetical protein [Gracilibacillus massiliensis]|uniref:hypothetical protein n=1 Tax=Gracilibacillus massiliensis TaxID=1564956 RepID=UPI00071E1E27|nr:hypothetical protein [Gracilibacillus massiliensis]